MRRHIALIAALSLLAFAGAAAAGVRGVPPQFPKLTGKWSHAEINVTIKKRQHTLVLDHGQITKVTASAITLRRFDGTPAVIPVDGQTIVTLAAFGVDVTDLHRGEYAATMIIDAGAAVRVRATLRP